MSVLSILLGGKGRRGPGKGSLPQLHVHVDKCLGHSNAAHVMLPIHPSIHPPPLSPIDAHACCQRSSGKPSQHDDAWGWGWGWRWG